MYKNILLHKAFGIYISTEVWLYARYIFTLLGLSCFLFTGVESLIITSVSSPKH